MTVSRKTKLLEYPSWNTHFKLTLIFENSLSLRKFLLPVEHDLALIKLLHRDSTGHRNVAHHTRSNIFTAPRRCVRIHPDPRLPVQEVLAGPGSRLGLCVSYCSTCTVTERKPTEHVHLHGSLSWSGIHADHTCHSVVDGDRPKVPTDGHAGDSSGQMSPILGATSSALRIRSKQPGTGWSVGLLRMASWSLCWNPNLHVIIIIVHKWKSRLPFSNS